MQRALVSRGGSAMDVGITRRLEISPHQVAPQVARPCIFVVEEDLATRAAIVGAFANDETTVVALDNGEQLTECLNIIARDGLRPPDLIAMGLFMSGSTGIDVLERLRADGWATPVLLLTWFASVDLLRRAGGAGASVVVERPVSSTSLRAAARVARASRAFGPREPR